MKTERGEKKLKRDRSGEKSLEIDKKKRKEKKTGAGLLVRDVYMNMYVYV